jgi:hypothetical protein
LITTLPIPVAYYYKNFDDSAWPIGTAPFGNTTACGPIGTYWPPDKQLVLRYHIFSIDRPVGAAIYNNFVGAADFYINSFGLGSLPWHDSCGIGGADPLPGSFVTGENVIVVSCENLQNVGWFDMEFVVSGFVSTRQGSWGALKVIYR